MSGNKQENKAYYDFCKVLNDGIGEDGVRRQRCLLKEGVTEAPEDMRRSTSAQTLGSVSTHDMCRNAFPGRGARGVGPGSPHGWHATRRCKAHVPEAEAPDTRGRLSDKITAGGPSPKAVLAAPLFLPWPPLGSLR